MVAFIDKIAVVTGGGSGIGRTICTCLAERGARVVAADRNLEGAEETVSPIHSAGGSVESRQVDVADQRPEFIPNMFHRIITKMKRQGQ
jgi:NAD(P)-dependent dehydrogenase (short-subunit alcohol dehydrogenase family)